MCSPQQLFFFGAPFVFFWGLSKEAAIAFLAFGPGRFTGGRYQLIRFKQKPQVFSKWDVYYINSLAEFVQYKSSLIKTWSASEEKTTENISSLISAFSITPEIVVIIAGNINSTRSTRSTSGTRSTSSTVDERNLQFVDMVNIWLFRFYPHWN